MYNSMAESSTIQVGLYQKIAELIGNDFSKKWFIDDKFKEVRDIEMILKIKYHLLR